MTNDQSQSKAESIQPNKVRKYDLDERTHRFSKAVRDFVITIPQTLANIEDIKQLIKSSGSVCANYFEASEAVSKKDFVYRLKICRKEAKESWHWLDCLNVGKSPEVQKTRDILRQEAIEPTRIFSASVRKLTL